jgi:penicillin-binding protein 2
MIDEIFSNVFKRRSFILGLGKSVLLTGLLGRLIHLQIFNRDHYRTLSDKNRILMRLIAPPRGQIIDCTGRVLAMNQNVYRCLITPDSNMDIANAVSKLQSILELDDYQAEELKKQLFQQSKIASVVKERLTWDEMATLQLQFPDLPGLLIEKAQVRQYINPEILCHLVGYVAQGSPKDLEDYQLDPIPGLRIGKNGLEKKFQNLLNGEPGMQRVEVNARRRIVRIIDHTMPKIGKDLHLTINLAIQEKVAETLKQHRNAAAIVMDVETGAIKAMVSHPGYDSNLFVKGIRKDEWKNLLTHEDKPLTNKNVAGQYSPGSTFKMVVALAALKEGLIDPKQRVHCPGHYDLGNHRFHCWTWKIGGHGNVNLEDSIAKSCDVYFYHVAMQLGALKISEMAINLGFGELTGVDLLGEKKGLIPTPEWARFRKGFFKQKGQAINMSIGQGVVLSTPIQLARMMAMLVNGGKIIKPHLVEPETSEPVKYIEGLEQPWLELIHQGMAGCVNQPGGTAYGARPPNPDEWSFGGKTGSTQVSRITMQQRHDGSYADLPYHLKDHALFVGFAPLEKPKHAISVIVEHGMSGGRVASPLGRDILMAARSLDV